MLRPGWTNSPTFPSTHQQRHFKVYLRVWLTIRQNWKSSVIVASIYRSLKVLQKKIGFAWNLQPLRHSVQRVFFLCNLSPTCAINFTNNMSRSGLTWQNICNLLTIKFKHKYFHKFVDWPGLYLQVYILHDSQNFKISLQFLDYWKMYLWNSPVHDLIINLPCRTALQNFSPSAI